MPLKILKECDFSFPFLTNCINEAIEIKNFPGSLKLSNIAHVRKKKVPTDKTDYRAVSNVHTIILLHGIFFKSTTLWFS